VNPATTTTSTLAWPWRSTSRPVIGPQMPAANATQADTAPATA